MRITLNAPITVTRTGAYIKYDDIPPAKMKKLRNRFTITIPSPIGGLPTFIRQHKSSRGKIKYLRIPRFGVKEIKGAKITNKITYAGDIIPRLRWKGKLNKNQTIITKHILSGVYSDKSIKRAQAGLILKLAAGLGKTFVAMGLISHFCRKTLIVVHTEGILLQWKKLLDQWMPDASVGFYYGKKKMDGDIVIGLIQSLTKKQLYQEGGFIAPADFFKRFDFLIVDECHLMMSQERSQLFWRAQCPLMIGLSATPSEDVQGRSPVAEWGLGPILDTTTIKGFMGDSTKFTGRVHMIKYHGPAVYTKTIQNEHTGMVSVPLMISQILRDPYRLFIIADQIMRLMREKYNILVFADRRNYLSDIKKYMARLGKECFMADEIDDSKVERLVGGASVDAQEHAEANAQVILTTYQYMSVGKSIPRMNALVLATPRKSYNEQTIKRVFRLGSDNTIERQIVDIVDWRTSLKSQWYSRNKYFQEKEFALEKVNICWDDDDLSERMVERDIVVADEIALIDEMLDGETKLDEEIGDIDISDLTFD